MCDNLEWNGIETRECSQDLVNMCLKKVIIGVIVHKVWWWYSKKKCEAVNVLVMEYDSRECNTFNCTYHTIDK